MDKKDLIRQYKETPRPAGVFRVRNVRAARSFVGTSTDLPSMLNRQRFQLDHGSHRDRDLQKDWSEAGPEAFTFEVLDELKPREDPAWDPSDDLSVLLEMRIEALRAAGESFYGKNR